MKKLFIFLCCIFAMTATAYAGDIPEILLREDEAMTYIGVVTEIAKDRITVTQKFAFKGDLEEGRSLEFAYPDQDLKVGEQYLIGSSGDEIYCLYHIKKFDPETGTIRIKEDHNTAQRLEEYINNGDLAKAEQERLAKLSADADPSSAEDQKSNRSTENGGASTMNEALPRSMMQNRIILLGIVCLLGLGMLSYALIKK